MFGMLGAHADIERADCWCDVVQQAAPKVTTRGGAARVRDHACATTPAVATGHQQTRVSAFASE
jgi:hypothetical protein